MKFLNVHTHNPAQNTNEVSIYNVMANGFEQLNISDNQVVSVGIHPWYIQNDVVRQTKMFEQQSAQVNVWAIGECGLDRLKGPPLQVQLQLFETQVQQAERLKKPVIIHCVKAFDVLLHWHKNRQTTTSLIVHGFNNNSIIATQLLDCGFYLSLGSALLRADAQASKTLKMIPLERLFLENDDRSTPIEVIYKTAATQLSMDIEGLKSQIWLNFGQLFNKTIATQNV